MSSTYRLATNRKICIRAGLLLALCLTGLVARAQVAEGDGDTNASASTASQTSTAGQTASPALSPGQGSAANGTRSSEALPTGQILALLQMRPEVLIETKNFLADQLTQQGVPTQADSISDEELFSQIASSADLRAGLTTFLRARGYVSQADVQTATRGGVATNAAEEQEGAPAQSVEELTQLPGADFATTLPAGTMLGGGGADGAAALSSLRASGAAGQLLPGQTPTAQLTPNQFTQSLPRQNKLAASAQLPTPEPPVLHLPAPYNLLAQRDLYEQLPQGGEPLKRFGSDVFLNRSSIPLGSLSSAGQQGKPLDFPIGPEYIVGPGDALSITLWGGVSQTFTRAIDREGTLALPEAGPVQIAGLTLEHAQQVIQAALKQQFRDAQVAVTLARLRTVRVYVVGDVQRPGGYDLSSLATPLSALYAAGGPTRVGSLRSMVHLRGQQRLGTIDLYDFLLHGMQGNDQTTARFEGGDTLLVPPAGPQVAVSGEVKRPAVYELAGPATLEDLLRDAGGATISASLDHIVIERTGAEGRRKTVAVPLPGEAAPRQAALASFAVRDGDRIRVGAIAPYSESAIYLEGHVLRPGRHAFREGMTLGDLLHGYADLLPEPAAQGEILRLVAPDLHLEAIPFDLADVLIGNSNLSLQPFDTIRIRGRYDLDAPRVTIRGEVLRPGIFPLSNGLTAAELVRLAGGFKRDAFEDDADLATYQVEGGSKAVVERRSLHIGAAVLENNHADDVVLKPGDVLTIHEVTGWSDIGSSVEVNGEVGHPGSYGFKQGEHLSSILRRAGDILPTAYPEGAVLVRPEVRTLEEKSRAELIRQIETSSSAARLSPNLSGDSGGSLQLIQAQQEQILNQLRSQPASGRLVIHISADIASWAGTPADIEVRRGDVLTIPKRPGFVLVSGQVYNASAITVVPGKTAGWYLRRAGGTSQAANRKEIFVIRANGSVVGRHSGQWYDSNVLDTRLDAGDVVVVPQKILGSSLFLRNLLAIAQVSSSIAVTALVAGL